MFEHHDDVGLSTARSGEVLVLHYRRTPTMQTVGVVRRVVQAATQRSPIALVVVIDAGQTTPDGPTRAAITAMLREFSGSLRAIAHVPLGTGFAVAAVRAVLASMSLFARGAYPTIVLGDVEPAVSWLSRCGVKATVTGATLAAAIAENQARAAA